MEDIFRIVLLILFGAIATRAEQLTVRDVPVLVDLAFRDDARACYRPPWPDRVMALAMGRAA